MERQRMAGVWWMASMTARAAACVLVTMLTFWVSAPSAYAQEPAASVSAAPSASPARGGGARHHRPSDLDEELPPDVREKLTPEQLHDIMLEHAKRPPPPPRSQSSVETVVPVAFFAMIILLVAIAVYAAHRNEKQRHETLRLVIERGGEIPTALLVKQAHPRADLRRGLLLVSVGVALGVLLVATDAGQGAWTVALVPTFLGAAYLAMYRFERQSASDPTKHPGA